MQISFAPIALANIHAAIQQHLVSLPNAIDSFLEDHIVESNHYQILIAVNPAGYISIHNKSLLTQFVLQPEYKQVGQTVFAHTKKLEQVQTAFVPTCDEFFLAHVLDGYRDLATQAYFFAAHAHASTAPVPNSFAFRPAQPSDAALIRQEVGDFFNNLETRIAQQELFIALLDGSCVGFGIREISKFMPGIASIGMFVVERFRRQGVGTATLQLLKQDTVQKGMRPVAGCWYYNHNSKKTLERAGMFSQTRLLKACF